MGRRSGEAQAAMGRRAGPMKHRNTPRGGARNEQEELLHEYDCESCSEEISLQDLVVWQGQPYHRSCVPARVR